MTKSKKKAKKTTQAAPHADVVGIELLEDEDGALVVHGVDPVGEVLDISDLASLDPAPESADEEKVTVSASGMGLKCEAVGPPTGPGNPVAVTFGVAFRESGKKPFKCSLPVEVVTGLAEGTLLNYGALAVTR